MYMKRTTEKYKRVRMVKSKPKALQHFKVDPYKQAESMPVRMHRKPPLQFSPAFS